jgi:hypothetical protein
MNWWMIPIMIALVIVVIQLSKKTKIYVVKQLVMSNILKQTGLSEEWAIQIHNLIFSFVIVPVFFLIFALFRYDTSYNYNWMISIVMYLSTFVIL